MPTTTSLHLHVEQRGTNDPLVLVHGSWGSRERWALVEDELARSFRVVTYDRRGHGFSDFGDPASTRRDEEDDLAWVIESLGAGPVDVVGNSYGGSIALGLAARRPDLVRSVCVHEPPLVDLAAADPRIRAVQREVDAVVFAIDRGEREAAAAHFVDTVAIGPGAWDAMPASGRDEMVAHALAFAREQRDPDWAMPVLDGIECPVLVTAGQVSPDWFTPIVGELQAALPQAAAVTMLGAGHVPHLTHPGEYAELIRRFAQS